MIILIRFLVLDIYDFSPFSDQMTSTPVASNSTVNLSGTSGSDGNYFWLGGNLGTLSANHVPGSYPVTLTLAVHD